MADQPSRSDFQAAANEATAPQLTKEPTRPETVRSAVAGWAQSPDLVSQERSAIAAVKMAAQMKEQRQPEQPAQPDAKQQAEKTQADKAKEAREKLAADLAPKEKPSPDQQRQQQQQKQQQRGQEH
jgi:hypothetical protein